MALDLGELSGRLTYDETPALTALSRVDQAVLDSAAAMGRLEDASRQSGRRAAQGFDQLPANVRQIVEETARELERLEREAAQAGEGAGSKLVGGLKRGAAGVALAGAAAGAGFMAGLSDAMEQELRTDLLGVALGKTPEQAGRYGEAAANVYRNAFGESLDETAGAVDAVASSVEGIGRGGRLEKLSEWAITFAQIMDADVAQSVMTAQQLVTEGLVPDVGRGFDAMLAAGQELPAFLRGDLLDILSEYGPIIAGMGFSVEDMIGVLDLGAEQGPTGFDKAGDFLKEGANLLTVLDDTGEAYARLGLDGEDMAAKIVGGGRPARQAMRDIADAVLKIEDPVKRVNTALDLFGTPLEDLGKSSDSVDAMMEVLRGSTDVLGDYEGAMGRAVEASGDNATSRLESFKRNLQMNVVDFIGDDVLPALDSWYDSIQADLNPTIESMGDVWERVGPVVGDVVGWLANDVFPSMVDASGRVYDAFAGFWDEVSAIAEDHPELADAAGGLAEGFGWLIEQGFPAVAWFVETSLPAIADGIDAGATAAEGLIIALTYVAEYGAIGAQLLLDAFGWAFEGILEFANTSLGWIFDMLGMENPIDTALAGFREFRDGANEDLGNVRETVTALREVLKQETGVKINTSEASSRLDALLDKTLGLQAALNPTGGVDDLGGDGRPTPQSPLDLLAGPSAPQSPGPRGRRPGRRAVPDDDLDILDDGMGGKSGRRAAPSSGRGDTNITNHIQAHNYGDFQDQLERDMDRRSSETAGGAGVRRVA